MRRLSASVRIWFLANCMICCTWGSFSMPMARAVSAKVSSLAYWVAKLRMTSGDMGGRSGGESALMIFSNCSRVKLLTHPGGGVGWQAPLSVRTGSVIGTTLVLGGVAGGGGAGGAGAAAGAGAVAGF